MRAHGAREKDAVVRRPEQVLILDVAEELVRLLSEHFEFYFVFPWFFSMEEDGGVCPTHTRLKHSKGFLVEGNHGLHSHDLNDTKGRVRHVVHHVASVEMFPSIGCKGDERCRVRCHVASVVERQCKGIRRGAAKPHIVIFLVEGGHIERSLGICIESLEPFTLAALWRLDCLCLFERSQGSEADGERLDGFM